MSNSRFGRKQPYPNFQGLKNRNRGPQMYVGEHSGQEFPVNQGPESPDRYIDRESDHDNEGPENYGSRGAYRPNNYARGIHEESDFSFGSDYIRDERAYRPSRLSSQSGGRSWIGVGESAYSGDQGGRSYTGNEYFENPAYSSETPATAGLRQDSAEYPRRPSFAGRGPVGYKRSDERITEDINEKLTMHPGIDASGIAVETREGEVVLKGTVSDRASKRCAEDVAESCFGVKDVQNQLRIQREIGKEGKEGKEGNEGNF